VLGIGLVLGLSMVLGLAHFTFRHTSSPQNPASPHGRILPIAGHRADPDHQMFFFVRQTGRKSDFANVSHII